MDEWGIHEVSERAYPGESGICQKQTVCDSIGTRCGCTREEENAERDPLGAVAQQARECETTEETLCVPPTGAPSEARLLWQMIDDGLTRQSRKFRQD